MPISSPRPSRSLMPVEAAVERRSRSDVSASSERVIFHSAAQRALGTNELLGHMLSYLSPRDQLSTAAVNQQWRACSERTIGARDAVASFLKMPSLSYAALTESDISWFEALHHLDNILTGYELEPQRASKIQVFCAWLERYRPDAVSELRGPATQHALRQKKSTAPQVLHFVLAALCGVGGASLAVCWAGLAALGYTHLPLTSALSQVAREATRTLLNCSFSNVLELNASVGRAQANDDLLRAEQRALRERYVLQILQPRSNA